VAAFILTTALSASAQETTADPDLPSGTASISGKQLPPPDPKFGGVIKEKASESKAWWSPRVVLTLSDDQWRSIFQVSLTAK
jgi:hypothetical protein